MIGFFRRAKQQKAGRDIVEELPFAAPVRGLWRELMNRKKTC